MQGISEWHGTAFAWCQLCIMASKENRPVLVRLKRKRGLGSLDAIGAYLTLLMYMERLPWGHSDCSLAQSWENS